MRYAAIVLMLAGCQTHGEWRALTPAEIRQESKACRAVGMEPELVKEGKRVMWVTCKDNGGSQG